jgi:hypothetical protein
VAAVGVTLFVYGTLREKRLLSAVLGRAVDDLSFAPASAPGFRVVPYPGRVYPALAEAGDQSAEGVSIQGLSAADFARLDAYEAAEYSRQPVTLTVDGIAMAAEAYKPTIVIPADAPAWDYEAYRRRHAALLDLTQESPDSIRDQIEQLKP